MGFFGNLEADKYDRQYDDGYLAKRIWRYMASYKKYVIITAVGFIFVALFRSAREIIISISVDALENDQGLLVALIIGLAVAAVIDYVSNWARRYYLGLLVNDLIHAMRLDAFKSAINRDMAFYDRNKTGKVVSRITTDTQEFGTVLLFTSDVVTQLVSVFVLLIVLLTYSFTLTLLLLATLPIFYFVAVGFRVLARRVTRQGSRAMAVVNDNIQETVTGITVAKNFRQEGKIYNEFNDVNIMSYDINMRRGFVLALVFPVFNFLIGFAIAGMLIAGGQQVIDQVITAGAWYLFVQGVDRFFFPVINMASFWSQFQQGLSAAERVFALIDAENSINQSDDHVHPERLEGRITFENVNFAYDDEEYVLEDFDLDIKPGESVAFVGHTGAGKSTVAKLVARFYEFQSGDICIDGKDIRTFDLQAYRHQLGIVPQQPFLFSGTVIENIQYGRPDATVEEIESLAYRIGDGEWVESLPNGLYSDVGERGARLSMGQRQLVSLLRVMVQKPAIFILDEATASIDPFTETQIQEAIDILLSQSTSILIAHRLSTVRSADRIIVLQGGHIIEEGNHDHLMAIDGHYAELYNTYFRHQSLSYIETSRDRLRAAGD